MPLQFTGVLISRVQVLIIMLPYTVTDVEPLKKIALIPKETVSGDVVCCDFSVGVSLVMDPVFSVHVSEEDPHVLGPQIPYTTVFVQTPIGKFLLTRSASFGKRQ